MSCFLPPTLWRYFWHPEQVGAACQDLLGTLEPFQDLSVFTYSCVFLLTCALETPVYGLSWNSRRQVLGPLPVPQQSLRRQVAIVTTLNLCTHPLVVFGLPQMLAAAGRPYGEAIFLGEVFAPVAEGLLSVMVFAIPWRRAMVGALAANLWSWWAGTLIAQWL